MSRPLELGKYSIGVGDRFGQQARAQLEACRQAAGQGLEVTPVWNKSHREHAIVGTEPSSVQAAAAAAVAALHWRGRWHVDADHIRLETVEPFLACCDFFTLDVADAIGQPLPSEAVEEFVARHPELVGRLEIPGLPAVLRTSRADIEARAFKYLPAARAAGAIYRRIKQAKGAGRFITEVSMDETDTPQTPVELLVILAALADQAVPVQTLAPRFTGRFNKGVDYVGDVAVFEREFNADLCVLRFAIRQYGLPANLKLSVHSGSDKFSIYGPIHRALRRHDAGLHLKTAGTTWLEELIGLAAAGGDGLALVKDLYAAALARLEELCGPYASVIDIDPRRLPSVAEVGRWTAEQLVLAARHDPACPSFNPHLRQLLHVAYKLAAGKGAAYLELVRAHQGLIGRNVTANLYERHIKPVFLGQ